MLELCSIASGSSGNCICVGSDNHHVLIDAGISGKRIENGLNEVDLKSQDMDGILVTHEHLDHIAGLGVMARRYGLPNMRVNRDGNPLSREMYCGMTRMGIML